jgi:hypothetical protein
MRANRRVPILLVLASLTLVPACDAVDRVRGRVAAPADTVVPAATTAGGLTLGLQTPGVLRPGDEGLLRLSVTNRGAAAAADVRVELFVPGWVEPLPPRAGDREVGMAAVEGGTRFVYRLHDTPVGPGETEVVEQRIRVPAMGPLTEGAEPWSRVVRARLLDAGDQPLAEVASEISLEGVAQSASSPGAIPAPRDTARRPAATDTARPLGGRDTVPRTPAP